MWSQSNVTFSFCKNLPSKTIIYCNITVYPFWVIRFIMNPPLCIDNSSDHIFVVPPLSWEQLGASLGPILQEACLERGTALLGSKSRTVYTNRIQWTSAPPESIKDNWTCWWNPESPPCQAAEDTLTVPSPPPPLSNTHKWRHKCAYPSPHRHTDNWVWWFLSMSLPVKCTRFLLCLLNACHNWSLEVRTEQKGWGGDDGDRNQIKRLIWKSMCRLRTLVLAL